MKPIKIHRVGDHANACAPRQPGASSHRLRWGENRFWQPPRGLKLVSGSGWYHDEAIQAENTRKN